MSHKILKLTWCVSVLLVGGMAVLARAQQAAPSDREVARHGAIALVQPMGRSPAMGANSSAPAMRRSNRMICIRPRSGGSLRRSLRPTTA